MHPATPYNGKHSPPCPSLLSAILLRSGVAIACGRVVIYLYKMIQVFNSKTIVSIEARNFVESEVYKFWPEKKSWLGNKKSGFNSETGERINCGRMTQSELKSVESEFVKYHVKDNKVFIYPKVIITFCGGEKYCRVFDTYLEAKTFQSRIKQVVDKGLTFDPALYV